MAMAVWFHLVDRHGEGQPPLIITHPQDQHTALLLVHAVGLENMTMALVLMEKGWPVSNSFTCTRPEPETTLCI